MGFTKASFPANLVHGQLFLFLCSVQKFNCNYFRVVFVSKASVTEKICCPS